RAGAIHTVKPLKDSAQLLLGNPDAGIFDRNSNGRSAGDRANAYAPAGGRVFNCVIDQVVDNRSQPLFVTPNRYISRWLLDTQFDLAGRSRLSKLIGALIEKIRDRHIDQLERFLS